MLAAKENLQRLSCLFICHCTPLLTSPSHWHAVISRSNSIPRLHRYHGDMQLLLAKISDVQTKMGDAPGGPNLPLQTPGGMGGVPKPSSPFVAGLRGQVGSDGDALSNPSPPQEGSLEDKVARVLLPPPSPHLPYTCLTASVHVPVAYADHTASLSH